MRIEIVSHCWNYSRLLQYQLSSLVLFSPTSVEITMTVFYSETDRPTKDVLAFFGDQSVANVNWNWWALDEPNLFRRAIGRNLAALNTKADWIWFADCDMCFRHQCLDRLSELLSKQESPLAFPRTIRASKDHAAGDVAVARASEPRVVDVDENDFVKKRYRRAIGGVQIANGKVVNEIGYCKDHPKWLRPESRWRRTREDPAFRRRLGTKGVALCFAGVYRIRHSIRGRDAPAPRTADRRIRVAASGDPVAHVASAQSDASHPRTSVAKNTHGRQLVSLLETLGRPVLRGAEIGVEKGDTSATLLREFSELTLLMVDPWREFPRSHPYRRSSKCAALSQDGHLANRDAARSNTEFARSRRILIEMASADASAFVEDGSLDFVFIDGEHSYEAVMQDLRGWSKKVRNGGLLCGHDYSHRNNRRGAWGVKRAVDEFAAQSGRKVEVGEGSVWWLR